MPTDACLTNLARRDWLTAGPFNKLVAPFIDALREQRYGEHTIRAYLGCLAHFSYWIRIDGIEMANLDASLIKRFLRHHLPACACPAPCYPSVASSGAALRHMLGLFPGDQSASRERTRWRSNSNGLASTSPTSVGWRPLLESAESNRSGPSSYGRLDPSLRCSRCYLGPCWMSSLTS